MISVSAACLLIRLRTYLDARKAEAELQKSRAIRISTNYERGKTDLSDILYATLCSCRRMSCTDACKDLIEQIAIAYMDTSPEDFDALIAKLSKLL